MFSWVETKQFVHPSRVVNLTILLACSSRLNAFGDLLLYDFMILHRREVHEKVSEK